MRKLLPLLSLPLVVLAFSFLLSGHAPSARPRGVAAQVPAWENITPNGVNPLIVRADPTNPGTLYLGTTGPNWQGQGIWRSTNYGSLWTRVDQPFAGPCGNQPFGGLNWGLSVDNRGYVYTVNGFGCAQGLFRSTDGGSHWAPLFNTAPSFDVNQVDIDPANPDHLLVSFHSGVGPGESLDGGLTWSWKALPASGSNWVFFITPTTWLAEVSGAGYYRTTNSGNSWTQVSTQQPHHGNATLTRVGGALFAGAVNGVMRSLDDGVTWSLVMPSGNQDGIYSVGVGNSQLFTRTGNADQATTGPLPMKVSTDGVTWTNYGTQTFTNGPVNFTSDGSYLYASLWGGGLWRLPIGSAPTATATATSVIATATPTTAISTSTPVPTSTPTFTPTPVATQSPLTWCLKTTDGGNSYVKVPAC